ncbi:hypothetical protein [Ruania zhangjianzhongii]|uniref:hypothetical protein n=1 Tax=Ruania zhangjianzhongii TaxID=2603206 RepID=UPI0011C9B461|nr:hypothetical protein [Ruania zhangjianzhongii]
MTQQHLLALVVAVAALALLGVTVWAWRGRSAAARFWMPETLVGSWQLERCVLLGAPTFALMMLDAAVMASIRTPEVTAVGGVIFLLLCLPSLYFILAFLPVPLALYPRWAKEIKEWRRQANAELDAWLAERRSQR